MANELIAEIERNRLDRYRVQLAEYQGHPFVDVRIWTTAKDSDELVPTKKGITIPPALLSEVMQGLEQALELCQERGI
jgi:hypothetical protein